ncbi:kinase-like protein [Corynespora cassiicola Philippines]|uniref:non-specific serine/threonine protein kinase n=1 Tax=Corynespora cassiicola Philippines TaxID=1448308 RepID=A0A2T2NB79_CORCC|nr:kinase-like protein [Corynespora cassiicola Philippines]
MTSPPVTPSAELFPAPEDWRFIDTEAPCEWGEDYRPGGLHPVELGDTFVDGKYRVIRKLGDGSYSTVWLVVNSGSPKYVALKIISAKASTTGTELGILHHLSKMAQDDPNARHLVSFLHNFQCEGPNGKHQCLVFEPMGVSAASLMEELPGSRSKKLDKPQRYPMWMAKRILLHGLRGLDFLHKNGVVHGDFQPGNLLFSLRSLESASEEEMRQVNDGTSVPLHRIDGKKDLWAPNKLFMKQTLKDHVILDAELCVKLSDLGAAFWQIDPPHRTVGTFGLRAPEVILNQGTFGPAIDIWSFGCLIYEFLTGKPLFADKDSEDEEEADDELLMQLNDIIGPLPDNLMAAWPRAGKWYTPDSRRILPRGKDSIHDYLELLFEKNKPSSIDEEESKVICELIRQIMDYDPEKRPSAEDLLNHPWILS